MWQAVTSVGWTCQGTSYCNTVCFCLDVIQKGPRSRWDNVQRDTETHAASFKCHLTELTDRRTTLRPHCCPLHTLLLITTCLCVYGVSCAVNRC